MRDPVVDQVRVIASILDDLTTAMFLLANLIAKRTGVEDEDDQED